MSGVLIALGTMGLIALVGVALKRFRLLGEGAELVIAKVVFMVATPSLLVSTIGTADLHVLLTSAALTTVVSTTIVCLVAIAVLGLILRRSVGETTMGTLSASYVNAGNLGLPLSVYMLGNPVAVVPAMMFQLLILAPVAFVVLESRGGRGRKALALALGRSFRNPIIVAALAGLLLALIPGELPDWLFEPFRFMGAAAAPMALIALGMSLVGQPDGGREKAPLPDLALAVGMRTVVHPVLAWGLGVAFGLDGAALFGVVAMSALPTAQNVLVYALRYGEGRAISRDSQLITTALAAPTLIVVALLLG